MSHYRILPREEDFAVVYAADGLPVVDTVPGGFLRAVSFPTEAEAVEYARRPVGRFAVRFSRSRRDGSRSWSSQSWTARFQTAQERDEWFAARRSLSPPADRDYDIVCV